MHNNAEPPETFRPGQHVTWLEQRKHGNSITFETCEGEIISLSRDHAYLKTGKRSPRMIALTRLRLKGEKTELQEGVEAIFAANRKKHELS